MPCAFRPSHYQEILETALASGYEFISYDELDRIGPEGNCCILRHDIDYTPEWATRLGEIETSLGIRATYFFQVCAQTYNLRERETYLAVRALHDAGHHVGLHIDVSWDDGVEWENVPDQCAAEKQLFQAITGVPPCEIVSVHNPHRFPDAILGKDVPGMRHTYEERYFSQMKYLSDSQGWYEGCPCHVFREVRYKRLQLLTHPYIWPDREAGDFIDDMAAMVKYRSGELADYLVRYHPVVRNEEKRFRSLLGDSDNSDLR